MRAVMMNQATLPGTDIQKYRFSWPLSQFVHNAGRLVCQAVVLGVLPTLIGQACIILQQCARSICSE